MVQIWSMLASRDVRLAVHVLRAISDVPSTTAWITYVRCHDDIGWAVDDGDAAAVGLSGLVAPPVPVGLLLRRVLGLVGARAGVPEQRGDRRSADQRDDGQPRRARRAIEAADGRRHALDRILLVHAIILGWGGVPVLWMGDELALRNDQHWADEPGHADDNRWVHRPGCRGRSPNGSPTAPIEQRVFDGLVHRAAVRALQHLHASVAAEPLDPSDPGVLVVLRRHPSGRCSVCTT